MVAKTFYIKFCRLDLGRFDYPEGHGLALEQIPQETSQSWRAVQADRDTEKQGYYL